MGAGSICGRIGGILSPQMVYLVQWFYKLKNIELIVRLP